MIIEIPFQFNVSSTKEENGHYSCCVEELQIYFGAKDEESMEKKAKVLSKSYLLMLNELNLKK